MLNALQSAYLVSIRLGGVTTTPPNRDVGRGTRDGQSITPSLRCACTVPAWLSVVLAIDTTYGLVC